MQNKRALLHPKIREMRLFLALFCCQGLGCGGKTNKTPQENQPVIIQNKQIDEKKVAQKKESNLDSPKIKPVKTIDSTKQDEEHSKPPQLLPQTPPLKEISPSSLSSHASLSSHETIAVLKGFIRTGFCNGRTARCGDRTCSHYKLHAHFQIKKYEKFEKNTPTGENKQQSVSFILSSMPSKLQKRISSLTLDDTVRLHWNHTQGDARIKREKSGKQSRIKGTEIERKLMRLDCIGTCGKGINPFETIQVKRRVKLQIKRMYIHKKGVPKLIGSDSDKKERNAVLHTAKKYLNQSKLKKQVQACYLRSLKKRKKLKGRMLIHLKFTDKKQLEIGIKKNVIQSKEMRQCLHTVLQSTQSFRHSLPYSAEVYLMLRLL